MFRITSVLLVSLTSLAAATNCDLTAAEATGNTCLTAMMQSLAGGDFCGAFATFECCLKDGYSAAGCQTSQANAMLAATRSTNPALSECTSPTCSGGGSSSINVDSDGAQISGISNCDLTAAEATGNTCLTAMMQGLAGGDFCGAFATFECCLKDGYSAAGCQTSQANTMLATTRSTNSALSECTSPTCSGGSEPQVVTTTLMSHVHFPSEFDPTTFDIDTYINAVKTALGVSTAPGATLKSWDILVSYLVPAGSDLTVLKTAIATSNSIEESAVMLTTPTRRLGQGSGSDSQVDVKTSVSDAAKAKEVKTNAASVDVLANALGGAVTVKPGSAPAAVAVIETVVNSDASKANNLQNLITDAGALVGGTITAEVITSNVGGSGAESDSSVRSCRTMVVALMLVSMFM